MLEGGDPAIFTSDVSTKKSTYWISEWPELRLLPCLVETNCCTFSDSLLLSALFKLIANRWAWGRWLWKWVVVRSQMQASSVAHRYPRQPRERQPPPSTVTLRNSVEILSNLYTHHGQPRGREGRGKLLHRSMIWGLKLHDLPEWVRIIWSSVKTCMLNRGTWSVNTTDQHWLDFNLP